MQLNEYITTAEAVGALHLTRQRVWQLCLDGKLPGAIKIGRDWLIPRSAVEAYAVKERRAGRPKRIMEL